MKLQTVSQTGVGSTAPIVMNLNATPFNVGFGVVKTGTVDYTVEHTFDDPTGTLSNWFPHPTVAAEIADADGNYAFPVTAIRLTMNSGTGTATLKLIQAGIA
jgi:hypothetical protein